MSTKMIAGLVGVVMVAVSTGCGGADVQKPDTASQDPADTAGAKLPPSSGNGTATTPGGGQGTPKSDPAAGGAAPGGAAPNGAAPGGASGGLISARPKLRCA